MGDVSVHQPPQSFNRIEVRVVGRNEVQLDPAARRLQPFPHQLRVMVSGVVEEEVDQALAGRHRFDRRQQQDRARGIHPSTHPS